MTILFLTKEYNHPKMPNSGGAGSFIKIIANDLVSKGHEVHVFGTHKKGLVFQDNGVQLHFVKKFTKKRRLISFLASSFKKINYTSLYVKLRLKEYEYWANELKKYVADKKIDLIEAWDYGGFFMHINKVNIPIVIRCHGGAGILKEHFGYDDKDKYAIFEKLAFKNYNNIIAVSNFSKDINEKWFEKNNIHVIHNGIDTNLFSPKTKLSKKVIRQSLFYFGTLSEKKGTHNLAKIFNEIIKNYPNATLHLVGKGDTVFNHIKEHILSSTAIGNTKYYGQCSYESIPELLEQAHVIVFPTEGENFPFSFLEAMAMQKPVIVSDIDVSEEIIDDGFNGMIASCKSSFISKIETIFEDDTLAKKLSDNARKKILANFTVDNMTERSLEYYQSVIDKSQANNHE